MVLVVPDVWSVEYKAMSIRHIALALALTFGTGMVAEAKSPSKVHKVKTKKPPKARKYKAPKTVKHPKVKRTKHA